MVIFWSSRQRQILVCAPWDGNLISVTVRQDTNDVKIDPSIG